MSPTPERWPLWPRLVVTIAFLGAGLAWLCSIPYDHAPDEYSHFHFTTEFIAENLRLPIFGIDDKEIIARGVGSYNALPLFCYVLAAALAGILNALAGLPLLFGARLASLLWGATYVNTLLTINRRLGQTPVAALLFTLGFGFVPQVLFVSSYVNQDVHSLAISALFGLALLQLVQRPSKLADAAFGVAFGLLFVAKYNFFIVGYWAILLLIFHRTFLPHASRRQLTRTGLCAALGFAVIALGWYVRNFLLYGEFLGLHVFLGACKDLVTPPIGGLGGIKWLHEHEFFSISFMSMTAGFDYNKLFLPQNAYRLAKLASLVTGVLLTYLVWRSADRKVRWSYCAFAVFCVVALVQMTSSALNVDIQPQGRYMFPVFVPAAILSAAVFSVRPKVALVVGIVISSTTIGLVVWSSILILQTYGFWSTFP